MAKSSKTPKQAQFPDAPGRARMRASKLVAGAGQRFESARRLLFYLQVLQKQGGSDVRIGSFVSSASAVDSSPKLRPYRRRRAFPCWVSSASSGRGLAGWRCVLTIAERTWDGHLWTVAGSRRCGLSKGLRRLFTMFWASRVCPLRMRIPGRNLACLRRPYAVLLAGAYD
jgi:hypothetical protein